MLIFLPPILFGLGFLLGEETHKIGSPILATGIRTYIAGLILMIYSRSRPTFNFKLLIYAYLSFYVNNVLQQWAFEKIDAQTISMIYSLTVPLSALISRDRLSTIQILCIIICVVACLPTNGYTSLSIYDLYLFLAVLCSAYSNVMFGSILKDNLKPIQILSQSMTLGGICLIVHSLLHETLYIHDLYVYSVHIGKHMIATNIMAYMLMGLSLQKNSAVSVSLIGLTTPYWIKIFTFDFSITYSDMIIPVCIALFILNPRR